MSQYPSGLSQWNATPARPHNVSMGVMPSFMPQQLQQNPMQDSHGNNAPIQMHYGMPGASAPYSQQQAIAASGVQNLSTQVVYHLNQAQQNNLANQATATQSVSSSSDTAESTNLHVRRLHQKVDEKSLTAVFSQFGYVVSSLVMRNIHTGHSLGTGFVRFRRHEDAKRAIEEMQGRKVMGKNIIVEWAQLQTEVADSEEQGKRTKRCGQSQIERARSKKLFIRNIPRTVTMAELCGLFTPYGVVENITVHEDTTPNPKIPLNEQRIIAFVSFTEPGCAMHACDAIHSSTPFPACNGTRLLVKVVQVNQETPALSSITTGYPACGPQENFFPALNTVNMHAATRVSSAAPASAGAFQVYSAPSHYNTRSSAIVECNGMPSTSQYQYECFSPDSSASLGSDSMAVTAMASQSIPTWRPDVKLTSADAQTSHSATSISGDLTESGEDRDDITSFRSSSSADGTHTGVSTTSAASSQARSSRLRVSFALPLPDTASDVSSSTPSTGESPLKRTYGKVYRHNPYGSY